MQNVRIAAACPLLHAHYHCNDIANASRYHMHHLWLHHTMDIAYVIAEFQMKFPSTALKCMQLLGTASQLTLDSKAMQASDERRGAHTQLCHVYSTR